MRRYTSDDTLQSQKSGDKRKDSDKTSEGSQLQVEDSQSRQFISAGPTRHGERKFAFTSRFQFILTLIAMKTDVPFLTDIAMMVQTENAYYILFPIFVSSIIVALPLMAEQIFFGQFTRYGYLKVWNMAPIGFGIGVSMLILSFYDCIAWIAYTGLLILYLVRIPFRKEESWTKCFTNRDYSGLTCYDSKSSHETQICDLTTYPAYEFYKSLVKLQSGDNPFRVNWLWFLCCVLVWICLFIMVSLGFRRYKSIIKVIPLVYMIFTLLLILFSFWYHGNNEGTRKMFKKVPLPPVSLFFLMVVKATRISKLALGALNQIGCYSPSTSLVVTDSVISILISNAITFSVTYFIFCSHGWVANGFKGIDSDCLALNHQMIVFASLPTAVAALPMSNLWLFTYYLCLSLKMLLELVIISTANFNSVMDIFHRLNYHRAWLALAVSIIGIMLTLPFTMLPGETLFILIEHHVNIIVDANILFAACLMILFIYSVPRVFDDIHFTYQLELVAFVKIIFYVSPILMIFSAGAINWENIRTNQISDQLPEWSTRFVWISVFVILAPIPLFMLYMYMRQLSKHDMTAMFHPTVFWGPPEPERRRARRSFNPRLSLRYKANEPCTHDCLLDNARLQVETKKREQARREFFREFFDQSVFEKWDDLYVWYHPATTATIPGTEGHDGDQKRFSIEALSPATTGEASLQDTGQTSSEDVIRDKLLSVAPDNLEGFTRDLEVSKVQGPRNPVEFGDVPHMDIQKSDTHGVHFIESLPFDKVSESVEVPREPARRRRLPSPSPPSPSPATYSPVYVTFSKSSQTESRLKHLRKIIGRVRLPWPLRRHKRRHHRCRGTDPISQPSTYADSCRRRHTGRRYDEEAASTSTATDCSDSA